MLNIALIAHDSRKNLLRNLCIAYSHILSKHIIYTTGSTGRFLEEFSNINIYESFEGGIGGENQIALQIISNNIDLVIYLKNTTDIYSYNGYDDNGILFYCDVNKIPIATNIATAEALLFCLDRGDLDWRKLFK